MHFGVILSKNGKMSVETSTSVKPIKKHVIKFNHWKCIKMIHLPGVFAARKASCLNICFGCCFLAPVSRNTINNSTVVLDVSPDTTCDML